MANIHVSSHVGLGDQIYLHAVLRELRGEGREVWVGTPWPALWEDIGVHPVNIGLCGLVAQDRERRGTPESVWTTPPAGAIYRCANYLAHASIVEALRFGVGVREGVLQREIDFRLRVPPHWFPRGFPPGDFVLFRPPSIRSVGIYLSRTPHVNVMRRVLRRLVEGCRRLIVVGDLTPAYEWLEDDGLLTGCPDVQCYRYLRGELHWTEIAALAQAANLVVTSPCFLLPLSLAVGANVLCAYGGHYPPSMLIPRTAGVKPLYTELAPEPFCDCRDPVHVCRKDIPDERVDATVDAALARLLGRDRDFCSYWFGIQ